MCEALSYKKDRSEAEKLQDKDVLRSAIETVVLPKLQLVHASLEFSETTVFRGVRFIDAQGADAYIHQVTTDGFPIPTSFSTSLEKALEFSRVRRTPQESILEKILKLEGQDCFAEKSYALVLVCEKASAASVQDASGNRSETEMWIAPARWKIVCRVRNLSSCTSFSDHVLLRTLEGYVDAGYISDVALLHPVGDASSVAEEASISDPAKDESLVDEPSSCFATSACTAKAF